MVNVAFSRELPDSSVLKANSIYSSLKSTRPIRKVDLKNYVKIRITTDEFLKWGWFNLCDENKIQIDSKITTFRDHFIATQPEIKDIDDAADILASTKFVKALKVM